MSSHAVAERAAIDRAIAGRTVLSSFELTCSAFPQAEAQRWQRDGEWRSRTYAEYRDAVRGATAGLKELGFKPGDFACLMARNIPDHLIADLAVLHAGGVPVSIYSTLAPAQVEYIAGHCEATFAVVEDAAFLSKFQAVRHRLPKLRTLVVINPEDFETGGDVVAWEELVRRGADADRRDPQAFESWRRVSPGDLATLIYTSGTTGNPKGVMITHRNVTWMSESAHRYLNVEGGRHLSYLPFAHVFERFVGHYQAIRNHSLTAFCPDPAQLVQYCLAVKPTQLIGVPRVWEKLQAGLLAAIAANPDEEERNAVLGAIEIGKKKVALEQARRRPPAELQAAIERCAPVWKAVLARVGLDEASYGITGAAPINVEVIEFFQALGLRLWEGWGMSECTVGGTHNPIDDLHNGSVGRPNPGVEMRIAEDGELLMRGGNVMKGYYKDPELTAQTVDSEGWLHTGDVAEIDADGFVKIVDRKKELIITAGGKNISPANLEALLKRHPLIGQAAAVGDRRPYVSALVVLDPEVAPVWARKAGIDFTSLAELAQHPAVRAEIEKAVVEANRHVSNVEGIKRFTILPVEWTAESEELTPTLKLKRRVIVEKYRQQIEEMYGREDRRPAGVAG